jgi:[acyl-carrier-protein] S-malonyltransferase
MTTRVAFLFPGQGSQAVGMGADIFATSAAAKRVFAAVDDALGFSLSSLCFSGPEETLCETINAQPAIVTVSLAFLAAFQEALSSDNAFSWSAPLTPSYVAGHSVGEWTALMVAGALDLQQTIRAVRERGRLMEYEGTVCPGGMAAIIGMDAELLSQICLEATQQASVDVPSDHSAHPGMGRVVIANYNAPGQIVISGERSALDLACEMARARGAKRAISLVVSGAFHSPVMQPAVEGLTKILADLPLRDASTPLISNISATPLTEVHLLREELAQQVASSVQWTRTIEYLVGEGVTTFVEIGPGQALTGMIKRIVKGVSTINISSVTDIENAVTRLREIKAL